MKSLLFSTSPTNFCRSASMRLRAEMSRTIPVNMRWPPRWTSLTERSIGKTVPSLRLPETSRPMPMILRSPGLAVVSQVVVVLAVVGLRHQDFDVLPDQLFGRIAEKPQRGGVEAGDQPLTVHGYDAIDRAVDDGPKPRLAAVPGSVTFALR